MVGSSFLGVGDLFCMILLEERWGEASWGGE